MSFWHNLKVRLGFADDWDDEYYDEDGEYYEEPVESESDWTEPARKPARSPYASGANPAAVRRIDRFPDIDRARQSAGLHSVPEVTPSQPAQVKMHIVQPRSFAEAQSIGDKFKSGTPVILNLTSTGPDLAKRMIDFCSGLTYGLDGGLQKVSDKVFMLSPHNVEVSDAERRRLRDTGFFPPE